MIHPKSSWTCPGVMFSLCLCAALLNAQSTLPDKTVQPQTTQTLQERVTQLESEVTELKSLVMQMQSGSPVPALQERPATGTSSVPSSANTEELTSEDAARDKDRATLGFLRDTTISLGLDSYYEYNFNQPVGRVNLLRAYDVLSNNFSLNQASVIFDHPPEVAAGRRWGGRLDLQFGQATDSTQGNPSNEPRPDIYRNIFQAYGTYIFPVGKGLDVDFGKWSSSLGVEGNYTKDQMNYSRSFWFSFLPYYHMGLRATYPVNDRFSLNYWVINGTNQAEATNGFKDELFGFTAKPQKNLTWTVNYYYGQDHPNRAPATDCGPIPVQPGLCFVAIRPAPNGRTNIFDSYATWQATPKLILQVEADYEIERLWRNSTPGESSTPTEVSGGAAYVHYQLNKKLALAARSEYMSDGGLFSGIHQDLKEATVTFDYNLGDGFLTRYEWRRDFSNQPSFLTDVQGALAKQQSTATVGLIWWWGRKEGAW
ncbi:MAG: porin [Terriglobales bacterium]